MKKIDRAGRISLSKDVRNKLGITQDTNLDMFTEDNKIIIKLAEETFTLKQSEMNLIREVYKMVRDAMLLDDNKLLELKEICKYTDVKCPNCGEDMYVTADKSYKCDCEK